MASLVCILLPQHLIALFARWASEKNHTTMAKSLRSKPKLRAKSIKRKGEFAKFVEERDSRLAEKNQLHLAKQKQSEAASEEAMEQDSAGPDAMAEDPPAEPKKISTSGPRNNSKNRMRAKKLKAKNRRLKF